MKKIKGSKVTNWLLPVKLIKDVVVVLLCSKIDQIKTSLQTSRYIRNVAVVFNGTKKKQKLSITCPHLQGQETSLFSWLMNWNKFFVVCIQREKKRNGCIFFLSRQHAGCREMDVTALVLQKLKLCPSEVYMRENLIDVFIFLDNLWKNFELLVFFLSEVHLLKTFLH